MEFYKYTGLGNDFIIMDNINNDVEMDGELAKKLCDRHFGIGADGLVLASPSKTCDIRMEIYNSDGSIAEMCGNASRCFAKFVYEKKLVTKEKFNIETLAGVIEPSLQIEDGQVKYVTVDMGEPRFHSREIPFSLDMDRVVDYPIHVDGKEYRITSMFMGVPHTVIFTDQISDEYVKEIGRKIEISDYFPRKTNVNFVSVLSRKEIIIRTQERGADIPGLWYRQLCLGSCGILTDGIDENVLVHLRGGDLNIEWKGDNVLMTGEARKY